MSRGSRVTSKSRSTGNTSTLTSANVALTGYSGGYEIAFADAENDPAVADKSFARTARVIPKSGAFQMGTTMSVTVKAAARSYAGVGLNGEYQSDVTIKTEPKSIEAPAQVSLGYGKTETKTIKVSVLPAAVGADWEITAVSGSPSIVSVTPGYFAKMVHAPAQNGPLCREKWSTVT